MPCDMGQAALAYHQIQCTSGTAHMQPPPACHSCCMVGSNSWHPVQQPLKNVGQMSLRHTSGAAARIVVLLSCCAQSPCSQAGHACTAAAPWKAAGHPLHPGPALCPMPLGTCCRPECWGSHRAQACKLLYALHVHATAKKHKEWACGRLAWASLPSAMQRDGKQDCDRQLAVGRGLGRPPNKQRCTSCRDHQTRCPPGRRLRLENAV